MKAMIFLILAVAGCFIARGQGTILFNNKVPGAVDARFVWGNLEGFGPEWTAQLLAGPPLTDPNKFMALFPTTTFKTSPASDKGYVVPVIATVPGSPPGSRVAVEMRAFLSGFPECIARTAPVTVTLGGGASPPVLLEGLEGITYSASGVCIPEPSSVCLFLIGAAAVILRLRIKDP